MRDFLETLAVLFVFLYVYMLIFIMITVGMAMTMSAGSIIWSRVLEGVWVSAVVTFVVSLLITSVMSWNIWRKSKRRPKTTPPSVIRSGEYPRDW